MEFPSPVEAPPPAYDAQEFDRKIADALDRSLHISQPPPSTNAGDEEWEEWDEAKYQEAVRARALQGRKTGGSSDTAHYRAEKFPLSVSSPVHGSDRAYSAGASSSGSAGPRPRSPAPGLSRHEQSEATSYFPELPPEEEYPDEPLPPFAPVGPSLEGPPFEEVIRQPPRFTASQDSPPSSPLDDVDGHYYRYGTQTSSRRYYEDGRHYSTPARQPSSSSLRPITLASSPRPPPMRFDPSVAYTSSHHRDPIPLIGSEPRPSVDPTSLYNSSVSSLMKSQRPLPSLPPAGRPGPSTMSSGYSRSSTYGGYPNTQSSPTPYRHRQASQYPTQNSFSQSTPYSSSPQPPSVPYQYQETNVPGPAASIYRQSVVPPLPRPPQWRSTPQNNAYGGGYGR